MTQTNNRRKSNFPRRPTLPRSVWQAMSPDDQMAWDKVSNETKFKIIFAYKDHNMDMKPAQSDRRNVNFSEGTPQDQEETGKEEFVDAQQDPEPDSHLLVNAAAGKTQLNPADVRSALSFYKSVPKTETTAPIGVVVMVPLFVSQGVRPFDCSLRFVALMPSIISLLFLWTELDLFFLPQKLSAADKRMAIHTKLNISMVNFFSLSLLFRFVRVI